MRAVVYDGYSAPATVREVTPPACPVGGAIVAVRATGVCRSDWHAWRGHDPVPLPHIPGHEFAGVVAEIGAAVTGFRVGDRVTAPFVCGCGRCEYCRSGNAQVCPQQTQPGFTGPGTFAELVRIDGADVNLVRLPDTVDFVDAAALGCRFATAYRALAVHGRIAAGQWLAVFGCGGLGLSAIMIGVALGARVLAVDTADGALQRAAELGADVTLSAAGADDLADRIVEITGGGAHVAIDAAGAPALAAAGVRSLRRRGRHVQVGLLLGEHALAALPMDLVISRELEIYGSHGMPAVDYPAMLDAVTTGVLQPGRLVGRTIAMEDAGEALATMDGPGDSGITVIVP
jgi:D-arabinose 1-dehydrogenase-like Zn-dependent alcohol dehydrogenase